MKSYLGNVLCLSRTGDAFGTRTFSPRFVEQETLTKQKRSFNSAFSFHWGKWNFISFRLLVQRHIAESKWELGNQNSQEKAFFYSQPLLQCEDQVLPPCFGDNTAKIPTKHSMTTRVLFPLIPPHGITFVPPGRSLRWKISPDNCPYTVEVKATGGVSSLFLTLL